MNQNLWMSQISFVKEIKEKKRRLKRTSECMGYIISGEWGRMDAMVYTIFESSYIFAVGFIWDHPRVPLTRMIRVRLWEPSQRERKEESRDRLLGVGISFVSSILPNWSVQSSLSLSFSTLFIFSLSFLYLLPIFFTLHYLLQLYKLYLRRMWQVFIESIIHLEIGNRAKFRLSTFSFNIKEWLE